MNASQLDATEDVDMMEITELWSTYELMKQDEQIFETFEYKSWEERISSL